LGEGVATKSSHRFFPATLGIRRSRRDDELSFQLSSLRLATIVFSNAIFQAIFQADHRGIPVSFGVTHYHHAPGADRVWRGRISESGDDAQIPPVQGPVHEFVMVGGLSVEWGRRCAKRWREQFILHADPVCRQGFGDLPDACPGFGGRIWTVGYAIRAAIDYYFWVDPDTGIQRSTLYWLSASS